MTDEQIAQAGGRVLHVPMVAGAVVPVYNAPGVGQGLNLLRIDELARELVEAITIVIVTHNMQQAARVSDYTGFFLNGELVEFGATQQIFTNPENKRTEDYITGRFG